MVAGTTNKEHWFFSPQCKPQGGESKLSGENTTGIGRKLANALYFVKCFKNNTSCICSPLPPFFFVAPPTYPGRQLSPQPSGILVLMTHVPIYIKPLELSISAGKFLPWARGWALSQKTGRGRPLWGELGIALSQALGLVGSSGVKASLPLRHVTGTIQTADRQLWTFTNNPLVRTIICIANQSLPKNALKGQV